jgi:hypothetical protein
VLPTVGDDIAASCREPSSLRAPGEQLLAHRAQLVAQIACRAARRTGTALAVLVQVIREPEEQVLGLVAGGRSVQCHVVIVAHEV